MVRIHFIFQCSLSSSGLSMFRVLVSRLSSPETVYGLGANALSEDAVLKIFQVCPSRNDKGLIITAVPVLLPRCCPYLS